MGIILEAGVYRSELLTTIQEHTDAPFGMLFLAVTIAQNAEPLDGKISTSSSEETSNDGSSKLDPVYDEDEEKDTREERDFLCSSKLASLIL